MSEERIRDYIIEGLLGRGGMGSVYLATHVHLKKKAALKVLLEQFSEDASIKSRFVNEASLLHDLHHKNIVLQKEFFEENGRLVLVLEYVDGNPLDKMIGQDVGPIPWEKALPLFTQILDGIGYAHSKGIVHRDIKPANVLISKEGTVKITDLGIAKIAGEQGMTRTGAQMGTLYYESPEQIKGAKDVDHRSDIFSLGMTLYEMLAGRLPFEKGGDTSEFEIMNLVVNRAENLDPREYYPHIPEWLVKTIQKATDLNPEKRFQSCEHFKQIIEKYGKLSATESTFWSGKVASVKSEPITTSKPVSIGSTSPPSNDENKCPKCAATIRNEMEFCGKCGSNLLKQCPNCNTSIRWFHAFCPKCGSNIQKCLQMIDKQIEQDDIVKEEKENVNKKVVKEFLSLANFVIIPPGAFLMGSEKGKNAEKPRHNVSISSFELLSTPVTQQMWITLMGSNPSEFQGEKNPVENVSWWACQKFFKKLNKVDPSYMYRLPSEAEWEFSCRAGSKTKYFWGDNHSEKSEFCWYKMNSYGKTRPVAKKKPNAFDLYDMSGNVWEWCADTWFPDYSGASQNQIARVGESSAFKCIRGGSWKANEDKCRSAYRTALDADTEKNFLGFRIVRLPKNVTLQQSHEQISQKVPSQVNSFKQNSSKSNSDSSSFNEIDVKKIPDFDDEENKNLKQVRATTQEDQRFSKENNIITDNTTGLEWQIGLDKNMNWKEAKKWVSHINGNWRLPSLSEFQELYKAGITAENWGYFHNSGYFVWSSQTKGFSSAWYFGFGSGSESYTFRNYYNGGRVFAVRSR